MCLIIIFGYFHYFPIFLCQVHEYFILLTYSKNYLSNLPFPIICLILSFFEIFIFIQLQLYAFSPHL